MLSKKTLNEFREHLVGWTLRTIDDLFMNHGFISETLPPDRLPAGRRTSDPPSARPSFIVTRAGALQPLSEAAAVEILQILSAAQFPVDP